MNGNDTSIVPVSPFYTIEMWAKMNEDLLFVPQMTEEVRDWAIRRCVVDPAKTGRFTTDGSFTKFLGRRK